MSTIAKRLERLRKEKKLTVKEIASRIGVAPSTYRDWEYGKAIRGEPYCKLAAVLGVSLIELLTGEKDIHVQKDIVSRLQLLQAELEKITQDILNSY